MKVSVKNMADKVLSHSKQGMTEKSVSKEKNNIIKKIKTRYLK